MIFFPSGLTPGVVSHRQKPVYSGGEWKWPMSYRFRVFVSYTYGMLQPILVRWNVSETTHLPVAEERRMAVLVMASGANGSTEASGSFIGRSAPHATGGSSRRSSDLAIAPVVMRGPAVRIKNTYILAIGHPRSAFASKMPGLPLPRASVEENEPLPSGAKSR